MSTTTTPQVHFRTVDGARIRYADSGGSQERTVLLTSPWPESVYAFAPIRATLADHARLFAVDLPGFGASERREELLSPRAMGEFLAELIAEVELGRPHILGSDVGTSAALFAATAHPERIANVIVGTGGAAVPLQLGEPLASWVLDPDLDKYRRLFWALLALLLFGIVDSTASVARAQRARCRSQQASSWTSRTCFCCTRAVLWRT